MKHSQSLLSRGLQSSRGNRRITGTLREALMGKEKSRPSLREDREKLTSTNGLKDEQMSSGEHLQGREDIRGRKRGQAAQRPGERCENKGFPGNWKPLAGGTEFKGAAGSWETVWG